MKIAMINFFFAYNYGAVLQCTALKKTLENMGHDVTIIDYRPYYQMQYYLPYPNPFLAASYAWKKLKKDFISHRILFTAKWFVHTIFNYRYASHRRNLKAFFQPYVEKNFCLTQRYSSYEELVNHPPIGYDVLICGSDQLWNPDVTWGIDPAYYLNFGNHAIRIAYAISPCGLDCSKFREEIQNAAQRIDRLSLREAEKKKDLESILGISDIEVCPDPTLLLDAQDYSEYEENVFHIDKDYVLFYGFSDTNKNDLLIQTTQKAANVYNCKIIDMSIDFFSWNIPGVQRITVSPGQFLYLIKNAKCVVTNSFHGTVFSILYKKNFLTISKEGTSARMKELLTQLGLENKIVDSCINDPSFALPDYEFVNNRRAIFKQKGLSFLSSSIKNG